MIKAAVLSTLALCLTLSCAQVKTVHQFKNQPSAIPTLHITSDTTATALRISSLSVDVVVAANIATTTFDISFYNPNERILEGEFEFPLADGQHIIRYALDINGALREAVVVEKAKARIAFENTVRRGIDPGLVEKTKGNNFRTRIYPIPAKGYKRVVIAIEQTLEQVKKDLLYQLPLYAKEAIDSFSLKTTVIQGTVKPQLEHNDLANFHFSKWKNAYVAEHHQNNFFANQTIAFSIPGTNETNDYVLAETHEGQTYFYVNSRIEPQHKEKNKPATIGIFWDVSASSEKRDLEKEMSLLRQYISHLGNVTISLIPFNITIQGKEDFVLKGSYADHLINRIKELEYDGGTQFGAIDLRKYSFDEVLLFSDGLSTFGKEDMVFGGSPVTTITSSPSANYSYLKFIANQTHGEFIDLGRQEVAAALSQLNGQSLQVIHINYNPSEIEELATQTTPVQNTGLSFAGKLKTATAVITAELGYGNEVVLTKEYRIEKKEDNEYDQVKRLWATMKISQLDMEYEKNKEEITTLGKTFSVVTQNTSLLVLDRVEDYVQYEITPPVELQKEYFTLLKEKQKNASDEKEIAFNSALDAMKELKEWWNKDYRTHRKKPQSGPIIDYENLTEVSLDSTAHFRYNSTYVMPDSVAITSGLSAFNNNTTTVRRDSYGASTSDLFIAADTAGQGYFSWKATGDEKADKDGRTDIPEPEIEVNEWKPDAPYLKILEQTSPKERRVKYLSLKKQYSSQPSFFVDVARFFIEKNDPAPGIQILSNVNEMKLEDAELLRLVANQLMDAGEKELAIETFQQVLKIREEDPQSYRDLALAYNETGDYSKAIELLYKLILGSWDGRFGDVKAIALNEMNAIISAHKGSVDTNEIDGRFIYAMPVDVRIVIAWNTDNSDIDLWVTDPGKEKCFYEHQLTAIGGKISSDVTQGYGPEEFCLKKAINGNYTIEVNLFGDRRQNLGGPIAINAELFTDFGKPTQKKRTINLRVTTNKEVINLGSLKFGS